ncbi:MAG TPA: DNA repair protein RadC [Gammaproteobacteria bacterium]|jgi:DNA repair protein RadC|nr:DNA repair protein RadC [Gammaproteobacteria bacterium]
MPISDWPVADRPREKLLQLGAEKLTDAELIAIFLKSGIPGKTALDIARELLMQYGSLKKLLQTPAALLIKTAGIGQAKYAGLQAIKEIGRRYTRETLLIGAQLNNSKLTQQFLSDQLRDHTNEVFACIFMDTHFRLICFEELFHGTVNEANIYPREIVRRSLLHNAAKVILAHNHPSGCPQPSKADRESTQLIKRALALVDIEVVDHVIVGRLINFSFAEVGWM